MKLKLKRLKLLDRLEELHDERMERIQKWHRFFVLRPRIIRDHRWVKTLVWLEWIERRYVYDEWAVFKHYNKEYQFPTKCKES